MPFTFDLDHISTKVLDTFFVSLNDFVTHNDIITGLEPFEIHLARNLFVYKLNSIHDLEILAENGRKDSISSD
jgi:hypothetical protein